MFIHIENVEMIYQIRPHYQVNYIWVINYVYMDRWNC